MTGNLLTLTSRPHANLWSTFHYVHILASWTLQPYEPRTVTLQRISARLAAKREAAEGGKNAEGESAEDIGRVW